MISDQPAESAPARTRADAALVGARCGPTALRIALGAQLRRLREAYLEQLNSALYLDRPTTSSTT